MDNQIVLAGITADAIFTTCATIFIFTVGLYFKWRYDNYKKNQKLEEKKEFYLDTIKSIITPMQQQAELFKKLSLQIGGKQAQNFTFEEKNELYTNLTSFDNFDELYTIFVTKNKGKNEVKFLQYKNIINTVGFLKGQREKTLFNYNTFFSNFKRYEGEWNDAGFEIIMCFDKFASDILENDVKKSEDVFFGKLDDVTYKWQNIENCRNIYIAKENLINPIFELCKEYLSDKRALILMEYVKKANNAFTNYTTTKETYKILFEHIAETYIVQSDKLEESYNYYKSN